MLTAPARTVVERFVTYCHVCGKDERLTAIVVTIVLALVGRIRDVLRMVPLQVLLRAVADNMPWPWDFGPALHQQRHDGGGKLANVDRGHWTILKRNMALWEESRLLSRTHQDGS